MRPTQFLGISFTLFIILQLSVYSISYLKTLIVDVSSALAGQLEATFVHLFDEPIVYMLVQDVIITAIDEAFDQLGLIALPLKKLVHGLESAGGAAKLIDLLRRKWPEKARHWLDGPPPPKEAHDNHSDSVLRQAEEKISAIEAAAEAAAAATVQAAYRGKLLRDSQAAVGRLSSQTAKAVGDSSLGRAAGGAVKAMGDSSLGRAAGGAVHTVADQSTRAARLVAKGGGQTIKLVEDSTHIGRATNGLAHSVAESPVGAAAAIVQARARGYLTRKATRKAATAPTVPLAKTPPSPPAEIEVAVEDAEEDDEERTLRERIWGLWQSFRERVFGSAIPVAEVAAPPPPITRNTPSPAPGPAPEPPPRSSRPSTPSRPNKNR